MEGIKSFLKGSKVKVVVPKTKEGCQLLNENPSQFSNVESQTQFYHGQTITLFVILASQETCRSWRNSLTSNLSDEVVEDLVEEAPYAIKHKFEQVHFYLEAYPKETQLNHFNSLQPSLTSSQSATSSALTHWTLHPKPNTEQPYFELLDQDYLVKQIPLHNGCIHVVNPNLDKDKPKLFRQLGSWCGMYKVNLKVGGCNQKFFNLNLDLCILVGVPNQFNLVKRKQFKWQLPTNFLLNDKPNSELKKYPSLIGQDYCNSELGLNRDLDLDEYFEDGIAFSNQLSTNSNSNSNVDVKSWLVPGRIYHYPIQVSAKLEVRLEPPTHLRSLNQLLVSFQVSNQSMFVRSTLHAIQFIPNVDNPQLQLIPLAKASDRLDLRPKEGFALSYFLNKLEELQLNGKTNFQVSLRFKEEGDNFDVQYQFSLDLQPYFNTISKLKAYDPMPLSSKVSSFKPYHTQSFSSMTTTTSTTNTNRSTYFDTYSLNQLMSPPLTNNYDHISLHSEFQPNYSQLKVSLEVDRKVRLGTPFYLKLRVHSCNTNPNPINLYLLLDFHTPHYTVGNGYSNRNLLEATDQHLLNQIHPSNQVRLPLLASKNWFYLGKLLPNGNVELDLKLQCLLLGCTKFPNIILYDTSTYHFITVDPKLVLMTW